MILLLPPAYAHFTMAELPEKKRLIFLTWLSWKEWSNSQNDRTGRIIKIQLVQLSHKSECEIN